ncbi:MAG: hypothetical protein M3T55_06495 [Pseudomonadota bacterium]|nr:hypothetical protein [Pseudomonadota bacterium]
MRWLAPGADAARLLTRRPVECLKVQSDPIQAYLVELGRAAFRDPLLLGGQAARAGLACETCHQNGRTNPNFDFPGLSGRPGTADVTSSMMSSHRGDDVFDPVPIPDLGGTKTALKISQARASDALPRFIHGLVTEEFDGPEPPPAVLAGLAAYVRALSPAACPAPASEPVRMEEAMGDARRAIRAAIAALAHGDSRSAQVMIQAARSALGAMAERYAGPALAPARQSLAVADLDLAADLTAIRRHDPSAADRLTAWLGRSQDWTARLKRDEPLSLYNPAAFATREAPKARS